MCHTPTNIGNHVQHYSTSRITLIDTLRKGLQTGNPYPPPKHCPLLWVNGNNRPVLLIQPCVDSTKLSPCSTEQLFYPKIVNRHRNKCYTDKKANSIVQSHLKKRH